MNTINKNRIYKTRSGRNVTIYTNKAKGDWPNHGCIHLKDEDEMTTWRTNGNIFLWGETDEDLTEATHQSGIPLCLPDHTGFKGLKMIPVGWGKAPPIGALCDWMSTSEQKVPWFHTRKELARSAKGQVTNDQTFFIMFEEIEEPDQERTLAQVCDELGYNVKIIK